MMDRTVRRLAVAAALLSIVAVPAAAQPRVEQVWDWHWKATECSDFPDGVMRTYYRLAVTNDTDKPRRLYADWSTVEQGAPYQSSSLTIVGAGRTTTIRMYTTEGNTLTYSVYDGKDRVIKEGTRPHRCSDDPYSR